jgi:rhodanese-related sulfurtransferase
MGTGALRPYAEQEKRRVIRASFSNKTQRRSGAMKHSPQFLKLVNEVKPRIKETNIADVKKRMDDGEKFLLVDVRDDHEWANGHLPGAVHMSRGLIERDIEVKVPETSSKMILYCGGGFRSALVADNLQKMGYSNVESMDGGWRGWLEAGLSTVKE